MLNLQLLDTDGYSWLKNSDFYLGIDLESEDLINIEYCSFNESDSNKYLEVINLWGVNIYPNELYPIIFANPPIDKLKEFISITHSKRYEFLLELCESANIGKCSVAIKYNELECLKYLYPLEYDYATTERMCEIASAFGSLECMKYLLTINKNINFKDCLCLSIHNKHINILKYIHEINPNIVKDSMYTLLAISVNNGEALEFLDKFGYIINSSYTCIAIKNNNLECLKYMREVKNPPVEWETNTPLNMDLSNHSGIETLIYAIENGYSSYRIQNQVIFQNNLKLFKLMYKNWLHDYDLCDMLSEEGKLEFLIYAHENGSNFGDLICNKAYDHGHINCVEYILSTGFVWDIENYKNEVVLARLKVKNIEEIIEASKKK